MLHFIIQGLCVGVFLFLFFFVRNVVSEFIFKLLEYFINLLCHLKMDLVTTRNYECRDTHLHP